MLLSTVLWQADSRNEQPSWRTQSTAAHRNTHPRTPINTQKLPENAGHPIDLTSPAIEFGCGRRPGPCAVKFSSITVEKARSRQPVSCMTGWRTHLDTKIFSLISSGSTLKHA